MYKGDVNLLRFIDKGLTAIATIKTIDEALLNKAHESALIRQHCIEIINGKNHKQSIVYDFLHSYRKTLKEGDH